MTTPATLQDLDAMLSTQTVTLPALTADMDLDELLEIAAETDERGPLETITGLLQALRVRHGDDDTTTSILAAIEHLHLPSLIDCARG